MKWKRITALAVIGMSLFAVRGEALPAHGGNAGTAAAPLAQDVYWTWQYGQRVWIPDAPAYYPPSYYYAPPPPAYYAPPYAYGRFPYYYGGRGYAHRGWYGGGWHYW